MLVGRPWSPAIAADDGAAEEQQHQSATSHSKWGRHPSSVANGGTVGYVACMISTALSCWDRKHIWEYTRQILRSTWAQHSSSWATSEFYLAVLALSKVADTKQQACLVSRKYAFMPEPNVHFMQLNRTSGPQLCQRIYRVALPQLHYSETFHH